MTDEPTESADAPDPRLRTDGGDEAPGDAGYDEWIAALRDGEGYALVCENGHGSLPPRGRCPHCGSGELTERPLPATGEVATFTETQVPIPSFEDDAPYVVAVASFGDARLTGQLRGIDPADVEVGTAVTATVEDRETTDEPLVVFRPA